MLSNAVQMIDAVVERSSPQPNIIVAVVRNPSEWAMRCTSSHSSLVHFKRAILPRISSSRISAPPPGIESSPASISRWIVSRTLSSLTSAMHSISGAEKQCRCTCGYRDLQRAQQILVVADLQVRMQSALQKNPCAAEFQHLVDFLVDALKRQDVAVFRAQGPVERAERAIFRAEIRVIDVAVDLVSDHARIVFLQAQLMRGHADAHQVIGLQQFQRFLFTDCHVKVPSEPGSTPPPGRKLRVTFRDCCCPRHHNFRRARNQPELRRQLEKEAQSPQIFFIQPVVDVLRKVAPQIRRGQSHLSRCFER